VYEKGGGKEKEEKTRITICLENLLKEEVTKLVRSDGTWRGIEKSMGA